MNYSLLKDRNVLITGANRGIGKHIALALAGKGCRLYLHSRKKENGNEIGTILRSFNVNFEIYTADLSDPSAAADMACRAERESGGIDILFNNAAVQTPPEPEYNASVEDYLLSFRVNAISPIKICDAILPGMIKRGFGRIVNITTGIRDQPELLPYAVSKAALDKYVMDRACKLNGSDVLMNLLDPGWVRTDMGGPQAPNRIETVIPGIFIPVLLDKEAGSGQLYRAQDYK